MSQDINLPSPDLTPHRGKAHVIHIPNQRWFFDEATGTMTHAHNGPVNATWRRCLRIKCGVMFWSVAPGHRYCEECAKRGRSYRIKYVRTPNLSN